MRKTLVLGATAAAVALTGVGTAIAVSSGNDDRSAGVAAAIDSAKPKNVILLVGDGMGESEITIGRYYAGINTRLNMDKFQLRGAVTTWSVGTNGKPDYHSESASTATAWSSGIKTLDGRLSQTPTSSLSTPGSNDKKTTFEVAKSLGKRTGNVTTAEVTDATPGAPSAHISQRPCQGPANMSACASEKVSAGGLGSVAEQQEKLKADITLGGGKQRYDQATDAGPTVWEKAGNNGYNRVTTAAQLEGVSDLNKPVLGLFEPSTMTTEWTGPQAKLGASDGNPAVCDEQNRVKKAPDAPSLEAMSKKAISLLSKDNSKGFFLQIEGASIDKQDHAANACAQIGETLEFDKAVGAALEFQKSNPDTLVIVTADHSHTSQIVDASSSGEGVPTGYYSTLTTREGEPLRIAYGTNGGNTTDHVPAANAPSQQHTGAAVPVFAVGPQAANVSGVLDQTDLYSLLTFAREPSAMPKGQTTTVTSPATTVTTSTTSAPALNGAVIAPHSIRIKEAKRRIAARIVSTRAGSAQVEVYLGKKRVATENVKLAASVPVLVKLKPSTVAKGGYRIAVNFSADGARKSAYTTVSVR